MLVGWLVGWSHCEDDLSKHENMHENAVIHDDTLNHDDQDDHDDHANHDAWHAPNLERVKLGQEPKNYTMRNLTTDE